MNTRTIPETYETLNMQVDYLEKGTNPIVYFPPNTQKMPKLPLNAKFFSTKVGVFYYNPKFVTEQIIKDSLEKGMEWLLLGYVQNISDAIKSGNPITVVARDGEGREIKAALIEGRQDLASMQAFIFYQWFPGSIVESCNGFQVIVERLQSHGVIDA
jgi:hypothetical protein